MLERAAVGLESGKLHRVLRSETTARQSCGIAPRLCKRYGVVSKGLERSPLPQSCPTKLRRAHSSPSTRIEPPEPSRPLDFLYPKATHVLLRDSPAVASKPRTRRISSLRKASYSSYSLAPAASQDEHFLRGTKLDGEATSSSPDNAARTSRWDTETIAPKVTYTVPEEWEHTIDDVVQIATEETSHNHDATLDLETELSTLLADEEGDNYRDVWDAFCRLSYDQQTRFRSRVVVHLSRAQSVVETGRVMSLIRQIDPQEWNNDFLSATILTLLRSGDQLTAIDFFKRGLELRGLIGGFEYLLLDAVNRQQWSRMLDIWVFYRRHCSATGNKDGGDAGQVLLSPLGSLPSLGALYFAFERYLATDDMYESNLIGNDSVSRNALRTMRRRFAEEALNQPCPPKQAQTILEFWQDSTLYNRYLTLMFDQWYTKKISLSTVRMLPAIYQDLRALDGAKADPSVLRGIFKIHYPTNVSALEQLREDWARYWGELSHWAFEKYLKLYSHRGDVGAVKEMWDRFVELYPSRLKTPRGFNSTLNVYAQNGDVEGAEREFRRMTEEYELEPDLSTWNTMLKCYTRADDYSKVLSTFDKICSMHTPDSFTYTHVMAMASKKGDLEVVLSYFNAAQDNQIPVTKEMALSLVVAYCKNDQLLQAEDICLDLAQRGITNTAMWNQVLHFNGMQGKLNKCYAVLNNMKKFGLEWDSQTIGYLLRALVQVRQILPAYQVIRDAAKHNRHILQPDHFVIVLLGAVKVDNRVTAEVVLAMMKELGFSVPFNAKVAYAQGALNTAPETVRSGKLGKGVVESLTQLAETYKDNSGDIRRKKQETTGIGQAVRLLVQLRDFVSVELLLTTFQDIFPPDKTEGILPNDVMAALMQAYGRDGNYGRVHELWLQAWPANLKRCSKPNGEGIYPSHQHDITRLVFQMTLTFAAQRDGDGLLEMVEDVTAAGFKLTSKTWDLVIQSLARLGHWERAMDFCETLLMPNWRGWTTSKKTLSPEVRQESMSSRVLAPSPEAILTLQNEWFKTRRLAAWSDEVARKLDDMEQKYPLLHHAFIMSSFSDSHSQTVLEGKGKMSRGITKMLSSLPVAELKRMQDLLQEDLQNRSESKSEKSPDNGAVQKAGDDGDFSTPLRKAELKQLRAVLRRTLAEKEA